MYYKGLMVAASFCAGQLYAEVNLQGQKLRAEFNDVTMEEALLEIIQVTGLEIETTEALEESVYVSYPPMALKPLLEKLLHDYNVVYITDNQTGDIDKVRIFSQSSAPATAISFDKGINKSNAATHSADNTNPDLLAVIPLNEDGQYFVEVSINGVLQKMALDPAVGTLALPTNLVGSLGLEMISGETALIDRVEVYGEVIEGVSAAVWPDDSNVGPMIGESLLTGSFNVRIDPETQAMQLLRPNTQADLKQSGVNANTSSSAEAPAGTSGANSPDNKRNEPTKPNQP